MSSDQSKESIGNNRKMILAQASLYPNRKMNISNSSRRRLLLHLQDYLGKGNIVIGSASQRLVTTDLEITLSPIGCLEVFGNINYFVRLLTYLIKKTQSKKFSYYWLFIDTIDSSLEANNAKEKLIQTIKEYHDIETIVFGGAN